MEKVPVENQEESQSEQKNEKGEETQENPQSEQKIERGEKNETKKIPEETQNSSKSLYTRRIIDVSQLEKYLGSSRGMIGSQNLGNTCFMNSSIQCLSNSIELTTYFLSGDYKKDINKENKAGLGGRLAEEWHDLLYQLWSSNERVANARDFKSIIGRKAKNFAGYGQQDSHEFITYFLDLINEDLNKVSKKPFKELEEKGENEKAIDASKRFWDLHLQRNDSIVTDLFTGQFITKVTCPKCKWVSITYDCFDTLSVPILRMTKRKIYFIPPYSFGKTISFIVDLPDNLLFCDIVNYFKGEEKFKYNIDQLHCQLVSENKNIRFLKPMDLISEALKEGHLFCFNVSNSEIQKDAVSKKIPIYYKNKDNEIKSAFPRVLYTYESMTFEQLKRKVFKFVRKYIKVPLKDSKFTEELENLVKNTISEENLVKICEEEYDKLFNNKETNEDIDAFYNDSPFEIALIKGNKKKILLSTKNSISDEFKDNSANIKSLYELIDHEWELSILFNEKSNWLEHLNTMNSANQVQKEETKITLEQCLKYFSSTEKLDRANEWYCKKCKEHQRASLRFELFYLPKLLIIHLKRFEGRRDYGWRKDDTLVKFPIDDADFGQFISGPDKEHSKYDLYAVSQHYGGCGGGHYTAICKNNGNWYNYNDSSCSQTSKSHIVTEAAYVLFYRRKTD